MLAPSPPSLGLGMLAPNALTSGLGAALLGRIGSSPVNALAAPIQWLYVRRRFTQFLGNLAITQAQREDADTKQSGVRACLNRSYWGVSSGTANSLLIGSWGKQTQVRPPRDVDVTFLLPAEVYHRFQARSGNKQSQLLQEIRDNLTPGLFSSPRIWRILRRAPISMAARHLAFLMLSHPSARRRL